jgi:hypothetical protein
MVASEVDEVMSFPEIMKADNIPRQYQNITDYVQWITPKKFLIFREFEMEIRTVLNFHCQKDLRNLFPQHPEQIEGIELPRIFFRNFLLKLNTTSKVKSKNKCDVTPDINA